MQIQKNTSYKYEILALESGVLLKNRLFARFDSFSGLGTEEDFAIFNICPLFVPVYFYCHDSSIADPG